MKSSFVCIVAACLFGPAWAMAQTDAAPVASAPAAPANSSSTGPSVQYTDFAQRAGSPAARGPNASGQRGAPSPRVDLGPPLKENVTISLKGTFALDYPVDFSVTGAGPEFTKNGEVEAKAPATLMMQFTATVRETAVGYQVDFTYGMHLPLANSATAQVVSPSVTRTITYRNVMIASTVNLKPGQPVIVLDDDGKTLTMTLTKADDQ